jgi:hypothetical protein
MDKDLPNLIRTNNYYNYVSFIKNYEDTLEKIFKSPNNSNIKNDEKVYLWEINKEKNLDLFPNMMDFYFDEFGIHLNSTANIVVTGPYIRNCLINIYNDDNISDDGSNKNAKKNCNNNIMIRREVYLFKYCDTKWKDLIKNIDEYTEKENEYILEQDNKKISLIKKKYLSPSHILLQHDYIKRIGWINGSFYVSSMFLIEYQKHKFSIMSKFKDPILNIPYDPMGIFSVIERNTKNPLRIIDAIDIEELFKISEKSIVKLYSSKTLIELCLDKYIKEDNIILLSNLEQMIIYLLNYKFKRSPYFYARILKLYQKNEELYDIICDNSDKLYLFNNCDTDIDIKNIDDVNNFIINKYIERDFPNDLINFLMSIQQKLSKNMLENIIKNNSKNIIRDLITTKIIDKYQSYYLVLMTGNIEMIDLLNFDIDFAVDFIKDIISNGVYITFLFLFENDNTIITKFFENKKNLLHIIKQKGDYEKIIDKIMEINPELINLCDGYGETPIIYHSKTNPKILEYLLKYDDIIDLTILDNDGNNCLHYLCSQNEPKLLKIILKKFPELIDMPNSKSEYPVIICCKNSLEEMFYIIKKFGANLDVRDSYGNTPYHYICANSMCLDMIIKNIPNFFGSTPKDYCKLSPQYYNFYEDEQSNLIKN